MSRVPKPPHKPMTLPSDFRPGDSVLDRVDGRSLAARTLRKQLASIHSDRGGTDAMSHGEQSCALIIANVETFIYHFQSDLLKNNFKADADAMRLYFQAVSLLLQLYGKLGIKRAPKQIPSLQEYLAQKAREKSQQEPTDAQ